MSLRQTPPHLRPLPPLQGGYPYRALYAEASGENRILTIGNEGTLRDLFADQPLRLLDLGLLGGLLLPDLDADPALPPHPRAAAAYLAAWRAVQEQLQAERREQVARGIRGPVLFVGFAHSEPPPWLRRLNAAPGLDDAEILSIEFLLADPDGWVEQNGLPF